MTPNIILPDMDLMVPAYRFQVTAEGVVTQ